MSFTDLFAGASPQERTYFEANFAAVPLLDLCRRLRVAEWNAAYRQEEIDRLKGQIEALEAAARPRDCSTPPEGWELPKAAADLVACAEVHGWLSLTAWGERSGGDPMVQVQLARKAADGQVWKFDHLTWVAGAGRSMKRSGTGLQSTPSHRAWHDAPSIKRICELIAANPAA